MSKIFKSMDHTILATFGQRVLLTLSDQSSLTTQGMISPLANTTRCKVN